MTSQSLTLGQLGVELGARLFERADTALVICDRSGVLVARNDVAVRDLGGGSTTCCELLGCRSEGSRQTCLTKEAFRRDQPAERRLAGAGEGRLDGRARAVPLNRDRVLIEVETHPSSTTQPRIYVRTLGRLEVGGPSGPLDGPWTRQRPGQLLGYLLVHRGRPVPPEEIADALWPDLGAGGLNSVRYFVHALRHRLQPGRRRRAPSLFVKLEGGGYLLDLGAVRTDLDVFESALAAASRAQDDRVTAARHLHQALDAYRGDLLEEHRYEDWARPLRDELHERATGALRELIGLTAGTGEPSAATPLRVRLAAMEPLDDEIHRDVILTDLRDNRNSLAVRRYEALRQRIRSELGRSPSFDMAELSQVIREHVP